MADDQRRSLMTAGNACVEGEYRLQPGGIASVDLIERAVARGREIAERRGPTGMVARGRRSGNGTGRGTGQGSQGFEYRSRARR